MLRALGASIIHGVEPWSPAADLAEARYDEIFRGKVEDFDWSGRQYDMIVFADVLEHMVNPEVVLAKARLHLSTDGLLLISIPNVRHLAVVWDLFVRGDWRYVDGGVLDRTHLRFYTSKSFERLMVEQRYRIVKMKRSGMMRVSRMVSNCIPRLGGILLSRMFFIAVVDPECAGGIHNAC